MLITHLKAGIVNHIKLESWGFKYPVVVLLILLVLSDIGFLAVHIAHVQKVIFHPFFSLESDRGYSEIFQYLKFFWIICILSILFFRYKASVLLAWCALFAYMLLDDSLQIHESFGSVLVQTFNISPAFNLRAQDFGELAVSFLAGAFLFSFLFIAYRTSSAALKYNSQKLLILVGGIVFFGVFVDMLHVMVPWGKGFFVLLEDGGELIVVSLTLAYCFKMLLDRDIVQSAKTRLAMTNVSKQYFYRRASDQRLINN